MQHFDLTPLFRSTVGFDRLNQVLNSALKQEGKNAGYPPYNILKLGEHDYRIIMAISGFREDEIDITHHKESLIVSGKVTESEEDQNTIYLHKGIATRSFKRTFELADHVKVVDASLDNGLLQIDLLQEIPEEEKPKKILINKLSDKKNIKKIDKKD